MHSKCVSKEAFTVSSILFQQPIVSWRRQLQRRNFINSSDYEFVWECGVTKPAVMMHLADKEKIISAYIMLFLAAWQNWNSLGGDCIL